MNIFMSSNDTLNAESFREEVVTRNGDILAVRCASAFTNALYTEPFEGDPVDGVLSFDDRDGVVRLSWADPKGKPNAGNVMKMVFGPESSGFLGIGESPRGKSLLDLKRVLQALDA